MLPSQQEILDKQLEREAARQKVSVEALREILLQSALDERREQRKREAAAKEQQELASALEADILIVTATPTEREQLRQEVKRRGFQIDEVRGQIKYRRILGVGAWRVIWIEVEMGPFGAQGSASKCLIAQTETGAKNFFLVGTAFGLGAPSDVPDVVQSALGDVLVSDGVCLYDNCKVTEDNDGAIHDVCRGEVRSASPFWMERFQRVAKDLRLMNEPFSVLVGTILSGGAIVESAKYRDSLVNRARSIVSIEESRMVGGEMEAAGMIAAAEERDWLVVKGVCDFADGASRSNEDELRAKQALAARNAAYVLFETILKTPNESRAPKLNTITSQEA